MSEWFPNPALKQLIAQWKMLHRGATVGTIADNLHDPTSDHQKDPDGTVDAGDFMSGNGVSSAVLDELAETLRVNRDRRIKYVIRRQRIFAGNEGPEPWAWRPYSGKYHGHVHVSTLQSKEDDKSPWLLTRRSYIMSIKLDGYALPTLVQGNDDNEIAGYNYVTRAQLLLKYLGNDINVDGVYGPQTVTAVKSLPTESNGKTIGINEWAVLYGFGKVG